MGFKWIKMPERCHVDLVAVAHSYNFPEKNENLFTPETPKFGIFLENGHPYFYIVQIFIKQGNPYKFSY